MLWEDGMVVHIDTKEEAWDVINYYKLPENGGMCIQALNEDIFLDYPYLCRTRAFPNVISGFMNGYSGKSIQYEEWRELVGLQDFEPAPVESLLQFIHGEYKPGVLVDKILKQ